MTHRGSAEVERTAAVTGWWRQRRALMALVAIVVFAAAVRAYMFAGFIGLDDAEYTRFAYQLAHGAFPPADYAGPAVFPLRIGLIAPTALFVRLLGLREWATVLYPFLLSLGGIVLVYLCAGHLFGRLAGLIAAALAAIFPWDIDGATKLVPDLPAAFFAAAGVTGIMLLQRYATQRRALLFAGGLAAGVAFGLSWLCKETVAYLAPFCGVWLLLTVRKQGRTMLILWGGIAAGALGVLVGEMVTYHHLTGDVLFRFHETERNYRQWENSFFTEGSDFGWKTGESHARALLHRLFVSGPRLILFDRSLLFMPLLGLGASLYGRLQRDQSFLLPSVWLWTLVLMFNFASSSTTSYMPLALFHRYLFPVFFPAIVLVSGFLVRTVRAPSRADGRPARMQRWIGLLAAAFITWTGGIYLARTLRNPSEWLSELPALLTRIKPETALYADALTLRALEFSYGYPSRTAWHELATAGSPEGVPAGDLVLINPAHLEWLDRNAGMWVTWPQAGPTDPSGYPRKAFSGVPPSSWRLLWQEGRASLYQVKPHPAAGAGVRSPS